MSVAERILNIEPLRHNKTFRWFWLGSTAQVFARQLGIVVVGLQIWQITGSAFWIGLTGLVAAIPMVVFGLLGGWLADQYDRKIITVCTTLGTIVTSLVLVIQAVWQWDSLLVLYAVLAVQASLSSLGTPARRGVLPRILRKDQLGAGQALNMVSFQGGMLLGPACGGFLVQWGGFATAYTVELVGCCVGVLGIFALPRLPPEKAGERFTVGSILRGVTEIQSRPVLRTSFWLDVLATVLVMPFTILVVLNAERFSGSESQYGMLISAIALGGVTAGACSGLYVHRVRLGVVQIMAAMTWMIALGAVAFTPNYFVALGLLVVAGAADTTAVVSRGTTVQLETPDSVLGRVTAVEQVVGVAGPHLGNFRAGAMAESFGVTGSLGGGAATALLGATVLVCADRELFRYRQPVSNDAAPERLS